jgi:uncharacterized membrane protein
MQKTFSRFITYLLRGTFVLAPVLFTLYIVFNLFANIDNVLNGYIQHVTGYTFPGLGIVVGVILITVVGFLSSLFLLRPLFGFLEGIITHTPFIKLVYTSIKDLIGAFVGNNKKFNHPVLVNMNGSSKMQRLGYITESDLTHLGLVNKIAVYVPMSYSIAGQLYIVSPEDVTPIEAPASEVMKFIVSGGVTHLESDKEKEEHQRIANK